MFELISPAIREELSLLPTTQAQTERFMREIIPGVTRARLQALAGIFAPLFGRYRILFPSRMSDLTRESVLRLVRGLTPPSLEQTRLAFAALFANPDNARTAFANLPKAYMRVFEMIFNSVFVSAESVHKAVEEHLEKLMLPGSKGDVVESYVSFDAIASMLQRINSVTASDCFTMEFALLRYLGMSLRMGIFAHQVPRTCEELPDTGLTVTDSADGFISIYKALCSAWSKGELELSPSCVIKAGALKIFTLTHPLPEFFTDSPVKQLRDLRMRNCTSIFSLRYHPRRQPQNIGPEEALKEMLAGFSPDTYLSASLALPFFSGFRKGFFDNNGSREAVARMIAVLKDIATNGAGGSMWVDATDLARHVFVRISPQGRYIIDTQQFPAFRNKIVNTITVDSLTRFNLVNGFTIQALLGMMAMLCSVGIIDMALAPVTDDTPTPLDAIRYVRLSAFGRYVYGLTDKYTPSITQATPHTQCELDNERLIITALSPAAASVVKSHFGETISGSRFLVTESSFFRKGRTPELFNNQVERLRALAGIDRFPPVWQEFFDAMKRRFTAFRSRLMTEWHMFEIDTGCPGLAALLTGDPEIRHLIRLVEGNAFLVKRTDLPALSKVLQRHGFPAPEPVDRYYYYSYR